MGPHQITQSNLHFSKSIIDLSEYFVGRLPDEMARAFGGYGERVTDPNEIETALRRGIEATENGQAALLEFITDKELSMSIVQTNFSFRN